MEKAEKERKQLNKKLIKESMKQEIKEQRSFNWKQFIQTCIGCFIGMAMLDVIRQKTDHTGVLAFVIEIAVVAVIIIAVDLVFFFIGKIIRRK